MYAKMRKTDTSVKRRSNKSASMKSHPNVIQAASKLNTLIESVKCSICLDVMIQPARIKCGHTFCTLCIENAIQFNKASAGTELRKLSGGSAKANCPLCKASNINKRSITYDPVLNEKINVIKQLQENVRKAAKELGFELSSVKPNLCENGTIEARSGLTPKQCSKKSKEPQRNSIESNKDNAKKESKLNDQLFESFVNSTSFAESKRPKTYGSRNPKTIGPVSNIAKHFKTTKVTNVYDDVYDELTFESPAIPEKVKPKSTTRNIYSGQNISVSKKNQSPVQSISDPEMPGNAEDIPLKSIDRTLSNTESSVSLPLNTISPRPKILDLKSKLEDNKRTSTRELQVEKESKSKAKVMQGIGQNSHDTSNSSSILRSNSPQLENSALTHSNKKVPRNLDPQLAKDVQQEPAKNLNETELNVDSSSSLALHTISPRPKRLKLMSKIENKENVADVINLELKKGSKLKTKLPVENFQENLGNSSSSLTLHSNSPPLEDIRVMNNDKQDPTNLNLEIVDNGQHESSRIPKETPSNVSSCSSLSMHTISPSSKRLQGISKEEKNKYEKKIEEVINNQSNSRSLQSKKQNVHLKEKVDPPFKEDLIPSDEKRNDKANDLSILKFEKQIKNDQKSRSIPFIIKGNRWSSSVFGSQKKTKVIFHKLGNIAPNEKLNFSITNTSNQNLSLTMKGSKYTSRLEQDPDKSGIVLETETSSSTQNTQGNVQVMNNHQSLLEHGNEEERPIVDDFDMSDEEMITMSKIEHSPKNENSGALQQSNIKLNEDKIQSSHVPSNDNDIPMDDLEEFINMDDPFSIDESDDDMFEATPEATFKPLNTSTTKRNKKTLSQSPVVHLKWKDIVQKDVENDLFGNFEIALHGDFGDGIKSGSIYPSKPELWQLLTGCGAQVYKSVNLFTFARGVTGLCIVNDTIGRDSRQSSTRVSLIFCRGGNDGRDLSLHLNLYT